MNICLYVYNSVVVLLLSGFLISLNPANKSFIKMFLFSLFVQCHVARYSSVLAWVDNLIGVISDTHDNVENVLLAVKIFIKNNVEFVVHCGDVVSPATVRFFRGLHVKLIKGNCDGDLEQLKVALDEIGGEFLGEVGEIDYDGKRIIAYHGKDKGKLDQIISGGYDYVLTGHTHKTKDERIGKTRIINPGAHYYNCENKIVLLDVDNDKVEFIELKKS